MWFSGLRGAIAFSLSISLDSPYRNVLVTTTLAVVLFTIIFMGGSTLPLLKFLNIESPPVMTKLSNNNDHPKEEFERIPIEEMTSLERFNVNYLIPFFTVQKDFTNVEEMH